MTSQVYLPFPALLLDKLLKCIRLREFIRRVSSSLPGLENRIESLKHCSDDSSENDAGRVFYQQNSVYQVSLVGASPAHSFPRNVLGVALSRVPAHSSRAFHLQPPHGRTRTPVHAPFVSGAKRSRLTPESRACIPYPCLHQVVPQNRGNRLYTHTFSRV